MALIQGGFDTSNLVKHAEAYELELYRKFGGGIDAQTLGSTEKAELKEFLNPGASQRDTYFNAKMQGQVQALVNATIKSIGNIGQYQALTILKNEILNSSNLSMKLGSYSELLELELVKDKAREMVAKNNWSYFTIHSTKTPGTQGGNDYDIGITFYDTNNRPITAQDLKYEVKHNLQRFHIAGFDLNKGISASNYLLASLKRLINASPITVDKNIGLLIHPHMNRHYEMNATIWVHMAQIKKWASMLIFSKFNNNYPIFVSPGRGTMMLSSEVLQALDTGNHGYLQLGGYSQNDTLVEMEINAMTEDLVWEGDTTPTKEEITEALDKAGVFQAVEDKLEKKRMQFDLWYGKP